MLLQAIFSIGEYSSYAAYERARFDVDGKVHNFIPRKYIIPKNEPAVVSSE